jgi:LuxR family maltose regulon positive regulatory protein
MAEILLQTKLFVLPIRPLAIPRPHLIAKLNQGRQQGSKLTLISSPAGFGKTTLVSERVTGGERPSAWLSLDEGDSDPARFLQYLVAALRTVAPELGQTAAAALQSPQPPLAQAVLTPLLNEISAVPDPFMLVLDDYHEVDARPVDEALAFLLEHLPPQLHLVITTREDPNLPLARLRVRGQLTELRAADLRFTVEETAVFLNQIMGLNLSATDIAALEARTEGWIAGLQMAALSMRGQEDVSGFIRSFTGSHRFVLDYLVEEVLQQQPDNVQEFLLKTAVLNQLTGPLCDALTGDANGQDILESLERANLFLVPLDNERHWYRYHHLFADLLRQQLRQSTEESDVAALHVRASAWFEANGRELEAFQHAAAANDVARAARLIEGEGLSVCCRI